MAAACSAPAQAFSPGCNTARCSRHEAKAWLKHHPFAGVTITGRVSTFGWPTETQAGGQTASGLSDRTPCIATRLYARYPKRRFLVSIGSHHAVLILCDYGPATSTGRAIDVTGAGAIRMHLSPFGFPTDSYGTARLLRR